MEVYSFSSPLLHLPRCIRKLSCSHSPPLFATSYFYSKLAIPTTQKSATSTVLDWLHSCPFCFSSFGFSPLLGWFRCGSESLRLILQFLCSFLLIRNSPRSFSSTRLMYVFWHCWNGQRISKTCSLLSWSPVVGHFVSSFSLIIHQHRHFR